jgi:hypothetical protein
MRRANFRRAEYARVNLVTHASKVAPHLAQPESHVPSHVFKEAPLGLNISNELCNARPEMSRVIGAPSLPGNGKRLARVSPNDSLHAATPCSAIEGVQISPDRRVM